MYAKIFASLYQGTLRGKPHEILVFTNMLAHADRDGVVDMHFRAIAEETGLAIDAVRSAVEYLESPDPESRTPDEGGRRIARLDAHRAWGWRVVNYFHYRDIRNDDERREKNRLKIAAYRANLKSKTVTDVKPVVTNCNQPVVDVKPNVTNVAHAEVDAEANADGKPKDEVSPEPPKRRSEPPAAAVAVPPVMMFPCKGRGPKEWPLEPAKVTEYAASFPGVDVLAECRKARQWCVDNPTKQKTFTGLPAFLNRWLAKAQNESGHSGRRSPGRESFDEKALRYTRGMLEPYVGGDDECPTNGV